MSYTNPFLRDFCPVYLAVLKAKALQPEHVELEVIDEEPEGCSIFAPVGVPEVLVQLAGVLNYLTIYTERPAYFYGFAETMYEEYGLVVRFFFKEGLRGCLQRQEKWGNRSNADRSSLRMDEYPGHRSVSHAKVVLDFEWEGECRQSQIQDGRYYIPIHKKRWETAENLDIAVPIGYNTVIVKSIHERTQKPRRDRLEEAFYNGRDTEDW